MMGERGLGLAHTTILRWVQHYTPEFEKRWSRFARPVGGSWRMDETYVKVRGEWVYLYRAVDKAGKTVDFFLSRHRDINAAKAFLRKAMRGQRVPTKVTMPNGRCRMHGGTSTGPRTPDRGLCVQGVKLPGELKILRADPAGIVGGEINSHAIVDV